MKQSIANLPISPMPQPAHGEDDTVTKIHHTVTIEVRGCGSLRSAPFVPKDSEVEPIHCVILVVIKIGNVSNIT